MGVEKRSSGPFLPEPRNLKAKGVQWTSWPEPGNLKAKEVQWTFFA
ncbi:hypothetical protein AF62_04430 [Streptococcus uberis C8329]|nr:hypothetical protein AF59_07285 [Streptococcus uberis C5072]KKF49597.1 hypothetical protein AF62_04430 [Streptococcus uberis C8329]